MVNILYRESATATKPGTTSVKGSGLTILELDGNFRSVKDGIDSIVSGSTTLTSTPFAGTPTAPTAAVNTNTTQIATTEFVISQIADDAPTKTGSGASGTWSISVTGNAGTVTNGVVTTGSYADPSWITSLSGTKVINAVLTTGSYTDPSWIASLSGTKLTGTVVATNGVVTTGSYANPSWITSLSETKVLPSQTGNSGKYLSTDGTSTSWQLAGPALNDDNTTDTTQYIGMSRSTSGNWQSAYTASTKLYFNPSSGTLNATTFNSLSDITQKKNINSINNALDIIHQINGVEFDWNDTGKKSAGVVAQDIEKVLPHLVDTNDQGIKSVNYNGLIAYLIEAIKQLQPINKL